MRPVSLVVRGATLLTSEPKLCTAMRMVDVAIRTDGMIASIDDARTMWNRKAAPKVQTLDARGMLLAPGLVDAHCLLTNNTPPLQCGGVEPTYDDVVARSVARMADMVRCGITTACILAVDHPDAVAEAAVRVGMRAVIAPIVRDRTTRGDPAIVASDDIDKIAAFARRWRPHPLIRVAVGLCDLPASRQAYVGGIVWGARDRDLHVHARLNGDDGDDGATKPMQPGQQTPSVRLAMVVLGVRPGTISVVADGAVTVDDLHVMGMADLGIVYDAMHSLNPLDNDRASTTAKTATTSATVPDPTQDLAMEKRHVRRLPTMALSMGAANPFARMRAVLSTRSSLDASQMVEMATAGGGRVLGLDRCGVGALRVGGVADMLLIDPRRLGQSLADATFCRAVASIVQRGHPTDIACTIINGRVVAMNGQAMLVDECRPDRDIFSCCS
ncbi:metallo-dependent hydrolase domain containing protein [Pandoravirus celtis]|uniref:Metallo-dependent hydrolase domain containing protein n=1 Tax=Pandoravirus celtis TaxID=2568002 RepID=A0A4D6EII9_9VIRU|nr:metallo-dependent hydrolase domain containing protein [Pandoravirus celtis]